MKRRKHNRITYLLLILLLCVFFITSFGLAYAKYVKQQQLTNTLTVTADIGEVLLQEHVAVRKDDGSYELTNELLPNETVDGNAYVIMPGVDIPKDPFITINKTSDLLPVYVYIKVHSSIDNESISYEVDSHNWKFIEINTLGSHVYVYTGGTNEALAVNESISEPIYILKDNKITVDRDLLHGNKIDTQNLNFTAAIFQVASGNDATEVYKNGNRNQ